MKTSASLERFALAPQRGDGSLLLENLLQRAALGDVDSLVVLADALEEVGAPDVAERAAMLARGVQRRMGVRVRGRARAPSASAWEALRHDVRRVAREVREGLTVRKLPTVVLVVTHVPLDRNGYDRHGRYWGGGQRLFYVESVRSISLEEAPWLERRSHDWEYGRLFGAWHDPHSHRDMFFVETYVRAPDARTARRLVAEALDVHGVPPTSRGRR